MKLTVKSWLNDKQEWRKKRYRSKNQYHRKKKTNQDKTDRNQRSEGKKKRKGELEDEKLTAILLLYPWVFFFFFLCLCISFGHCLLFRSSLRNLGAVRNQTTRVVGYWQLVGGVVESVILLSLRLRVSETEICHCD